MSAQNNKKQQDVPVEFRLDALEEELFRQHEILELPQLPRGSGIFDGQKRSTYTLIEAHAIDEMEKKTEKRNPNAQANAQATALRSIGSYSQLGGNHPASNNSLKELVDNNNNNNNKKGKRNSGAIKHTLQLPMKKTSSWWRWSEEVFRRLRANDVARILPTKNWRDDAALKIPPIGAKTVIMNNTTINDDDDTVEVEDVDMEEAQKKIRSSAGELATTSSHGAGDNISPQIQQQNAPSLTNPFALLLPPPPLEAFQPLGDEATRATQSFACLTNDEIRELCFAFFTMSKEIGNMLRKESDDEEDDDDDDDDEDKEEDEDIADSFLGNVFNGDESARDRWMKTPPKKVASRSSSRMSKQVECVEEKEKTEEDLIIMRTRIWLAEIVVKIVERRKEAIENHRKKFDKDVIITNDMNDSGTFGPGGKFMGAGKLPKKRRGGGSKRGGKKSAWTSKAKLKQLEELQAMQIKQERSDGEVKIEQTNDESEDTTNTSIRGSGYLETKLEILAKEQQLQNRINATFGTSGDHDAVERIALGEAAHPHTLHLMQSAFKTPCFKDMDEDAFDDENTKKEQGAALKKKSMKAKGAKRVKACAVCEKGSSHAKMTCGTDDAQFRCEKLRERVLEEIKEEKKRKAVIVEEDEEKQKSYVSKKKIRRNKKSAAAAVDNNEVILKRAAKSPFSPDFGNRKNFPSLAVVPMQGFAADKESDDEEGENALLDAKDELKRLHKLFLNNPELVSCVPCDDVENELLTCQYELLYQINANRSNLTTFFQEITGKIEEEAIILDNRYIGISEANAFVHTIREARRKEKREKRVKDQQQALEKAAAAAEESTRQAFRRRLGEQVAAATGNADNLILPDGVLQMPDESAIVARPRRGVALANAALQVLGLRGLGFFGTNPKETAALLDTKQNSFSEQPKLQPNIVDARSLFQLLDPLHASTDRMVLDTCNVCANSCLASKFVKDRVLFRCLGCDVTVHDGCYGTLLQKNEKHKLFLCDVCSHNHGSGYGSWPEAEKRTAHSPLLTSVDEKIRAHGKNVSCILCPSKLGAMKKASLTLPASQTAVASVPQHSLPTAWVHVSCAELVRGATTNPFADVVEINPAIFGGTIQFSGTPTTMTTTTSNNSNNNNKDDIANLSSQIETPTSILSNSCTLCYSRRGGCAATCAYGSCRARFHLCCARAADWHARFNDGSGSSKRQPRAYCDRHTPVQREKDESKGVLPTRLSTENENEVMVQTVRASADGKRGKISMLAALKAMRDSMRRECETINAINSNNTQTHHHGNSIVGNGTQGNASGALSSRKDGNDHLSRQAMLSHVAAADGETTTNNNNNNANNVSNITPSPILHGAYLKDLSHPGSTQGTPKKARSTAYARNTSRGKRGSIRTSSQNGSRAPSTAPMSDDDCTRANSSLPEGWRYVARDEIK
jgi:hypothetical protein